MSFEYEPLINYDLLNMNTFAVKQSSTTASCEDISGNKKKKKTTKNCDVLVD